MLSLCKTWFFSIRYFKWVQVPPKLEKLWTQKGLACNTSQQKVKCVTPEVNLMNPFYPGDETRNQGIRPRLETQSRLHQISYSGVPKRIYGLQNTFKKFCRSATLLKRFFCKINGVFREKTFPH